MSLQLKHITEFMENKDKFRMAEWIKNQYFSKDEIKEVPNYIADSSNLNEIDDFIQKEQIQQKIREAAEIAFGQPLYSNTSGISINTTTGNISYGNSEQTLIGSYPYRTILNSQLVNTASVSSSSITLNELCKIVLKQGEQIKLLTEAVNSLLEQKIKNFNDK